MKAALMLVSITLVVSACGGGGGRPIFERAEDSLARVEGLRAHLAVHALVGVDRTATIARADLPLERLHLSRWTTSPRRFACGHGFECARGRLDVATAARKLVPVLPKLPVDPSAIESATVEVRLDSRGELHRIDLRGDLAGADLELDLRPVR